VEFNFFRKIEGRRQGNAGLSAGNDLKLWKSSGGEAKCHLLLNVLTVHAELQRTINQL
jgi:hypothetical protein